MTESFSQMANPDFSQSLLEANEQNKNKTEQT